MQYLFLWRLIGSSRWQETSFSSNQLQKSGFKALRGKGGGKVLVRPAGLSVFLLVRRQPVQVAANWDLLIPVNQTRCLKSNETPDLMILQVCFWSGSVGNPPEPDQRSWVHSCIFSCPLGFRSSPFPSLFVVRPPSFSSTGSCVKQFLITP